MSRRQHAIVNPASQREPYLRLTLAGLAGPLCWVLHFATVYLLEGFVCIQEIVTRNLVVGGLLAATLLFGGACVWLIVASHSWLNCAGTCHPETQQFLTVITRMLAGISLLAILWATSGLVFLTACSAVY
jgi:uncharacterized protein involved in cysteine biosynthesis